MTACAPCSRRAASPPATSPNFVDAMTKPGALTAALNWYRATEVDSMNDVGQIGVPTMYVWSTDDIALGREAAEATGAYVERALPLRGPRRSEPLGARDRSGPPERGCCSTFSG